MKKDAAIRILLVEDDPNFGIVMRDYLAMNGFEVVLCPDGLKGYTRFSNEKFDLCILDVMMPEMDGFSLASKIRSDDPQMPLIFLTARSMKEDVVKGFTLGADDYVTKPFDPEILLLRIRAVVGRNSSAANFRAEQSEYSVGRFVFKYETRNLILGDQVRTLSPKESEVLRLLCMHAGEVVTKEFILKKVWGDDNYFNGRSLDVFITRIRKYLKDDPEVELINIHGSGFRLIGGKGNR